MKNLVIVESPAKAKTIEKFLGKDYKVMSSYGHIRDLQKRGMSVDVDSDFLPVYEIPAEKKELVRQLKAAAKEADMVWLASDEDREGEAIAWHLFEVLGLKPENTKRIVFHEITKPAILNAIANPRDIDIDRVNAQQARRILDRIVGFELSPVLWKKIKPALSAGRVQSVTQRLVCEREKEIEAFRPELYYRVSGKFDTAAGAALKGELNRRLESEAEARRFLEICARANFKVENVTVRQIKRSPAPPFTTSTLQQEAGRRLGFSVSQTMRVAQKLYEDGRITYMRTDSTNLSELALNDIATAITDTYGAEYLFRRHYHTHSKGAQEAHEAIRPTYISATQIEGTPQEQKLYQLIWRRAVASQMSEALIEKTNIEIGISDTKGGIGSTGDLRDHFKAEGEIVKFKGFMTLYNTDDGDDKGVLPSIVQGESLTPDEIVATQRYTLPPARYNEEALVKKMEEIGIGRPSTYAPTISTIQQREYIKHGDQDGTPRDYQVLTLSHGKVSESVLTENSGSTKGRLVPTDIGMIVNDFLTEYFPSILDYHFTARVEEKFDEIAQGKLGWQNEMSEFYGAFHPVIEEVDSMRMEHKVGERVLGTDPASGRPVSVKIGRYGPIVQIGEASDEEKPQFASLLEGQSVSSITLEEALKLFELPRTLGKFEDKDIKAAIGRFGPYVVHDKVFVSIPKNLDPHTITLPEAIDLIQAKREQEANRLIKAFDEMPGLEILNGRYGPYIAYKPEGARKAVNYKIPKEEVPAELTLERVRELMEKQDAAPKTTRKRRAASK